MRLFALRGATRVEHNDAKEILDRTAELMREIMARNELAPSDFVSCIFTVTDDLDAEFPAKAARAIGFDRVPLLCAREIPVPGAVPRIIRVLIHYHAPDDHVPDHPYLHEARQLRGDLHAAQ
jgi:chorismate mutase